MLYESHITVLGNIPLFIKTCNDLGLKYLLISNDNGSTHSSQIMTKKFHKLPQIEALNEAQEIAKQLVLAGFTILRVKLELISKQSVSGSLYEEFHVKLATNKTLELDNLVLSLGGRTSKNLNNNEHTFATFRDKIKFDIAMKSLEDYHPISWMREDIVYDTNQDMDDLWHCECPLKQRKIK